MSQFDEDEFKRRLKQFPNVNDLQRDLIENDVTQQSLHRFEIFCLITTNHYLPSKQFLIIIITTINYLLQIH